MSTIPHVYYIRFSGCIGEMTVVASSMREAFEWAEHECHLRYERDKTTLCSIGPNEVMSIKNGGTARVVSTPPSQTL